MLVPDMFCVGYYNFSKECMIFLQIIPKPCDDSSSDFVIRAGTNGEHRGL